MATFIIIDTKCKRKSNALTNSKKDVQMKATIINYNKFINMQH